jgi:hypothetical protein
MESTLWKFESKNRQPFGFIPHKAATVGRAVTGFVRHNP